MDLEGFILECRPMYLDGSLAVGEYIARADTQTVRGGTYESIERRLAQREHYPTDPAPKDCPAAHGARLGARIHAATGQELEWILARRQAHEVCRGVPRAIRP
jgi:hypothetical protein